MNTLAENKQSAAELLDSMTRQGVVAFEAPIDVDAIARAQGIEVRYELEMADAATVGQIEFSGEKPVVTISLLQNSYEPRRRFTLAHEIGHFALHRDQNRSSFKDSMKTMSRSESFWNAAESEANAFAAQLLMPKKLIASVGREIVDHHKQARGVDAMPSALFIEQMADRFKVSSKAMEYRLRNVGILK